MAEWSKIYLLTNVSYMGYWFSGMSFKGCWAKLHVYVAPEYEKAKDREWVSAKRNPYGYWHMDNNVFGTVQSAAAAELMGEIIERRYRLYLAEVILDS